MHREILDRLIDGPKSRWAFLRPYLDESERRQLNHVWHRLNGWRDSSEGLLALKKMFIIATLSNGSVRLLIDMAKYANLPWDVIFSTELFETYKPNPKAYLGAAKHLSLAPEQCAMVAAHIVDLRAAASLGMKTIYVPRLGEAFGSTEEVRGKDAGGEVDIVAHSFVELASILSNGYAI